MIYLNASNFLALTTNVATLRAYHQHRLAPGPLANGAVEFLKAKQDVVFKDLLEASNGAVFSTVFRAKAERLTVKLRNLQTPPLVCCSLIDEFTEDMQMEFAQHMFATVPEAKCGLLKRNTPQYGQEVADVFPDASRDIQAACESFAFDLWTASVFHNMRVLEHGLQRMASRFDVDFKKDSWHKVIKGIEDGITELRNKQALTAHDHREITYYSEAASQFRNFKDAWRNHVSHAREHYAEADAIKVMTHVKEFMQDLAKPI